MHDPQTRFHHPALPVSHCLGREAVSYHGLSRDRRVGAVARKPIVRQQDECEVREISADHALRHARALEVPHVVRRWILAPHDPELVCHMV